jgi:hypothetical protein
MKLLTFLACASLVQAKQPNILFLFSDDHALRSISAYGGDLAKIAPTPNIDRLAATGAIFENSFCGNSICGPLPSHHHDWKTQPQKWLPSQHRKGP